MSSWTRLILLWDKFNISSEVSSENWNLSSVWSLLWDNDKNCNLEHPFSRFCGNLKYVSLHLFLRLKDTKVIQENIVCIPPFV